MVPSSGHVVSSLTNSLPHVRQHFFDWICFSMVTAGVMVLTMLNFLLPVHKHDRNSISCVVKEKLYFRSRLTPVGSRCQPVASRLPADLQVGSRRFPQVARRLPVDWQSIGSRLAVDLQVGSSRLVARFRCSGTLHVDVSPNEHRHQNYRPASWVWSRAGCGVAFG